MKMIDKNKDKRFTQVNESLISDRKTLILKLEKESKKIEKHIDNSEKKLQEIANNIKKQRILPRTKSEYKYQIICTCNNIYDTNSDPHAKLKTDRPLCKKCRKRLE